MKRACEKPGDERFSVWPLLLEAHAVLVDRLGRDLEGNGGPPLAWYDVMVQLSAAPGNRLSMRELADRVLLSKSGVTRLVDRMSDAGYVARDSCAEDRRIVYAKLTDKGRSILDQVMPGHIDDVDRYFSRHLSPEEARVLTKVLEKVVSAARDRDGAST